MIAFDKSTIKIDHMFNYIPSQIYFKIWPSIRHDITHDRYATLLYFTILMQKQCKEEKNK